MIRFLLKLFSRDYRLFGAIRSSQWEIVRSEFIKKNPICSICGSRKDLNVHHIQPFHIIPTLELDPKNLITLCHPHHLYFAHFGNWKLWNVSIVEDAKIWNNKLKQ